MTNAAKTKLDVYGIVTDRILAALDKGVIPWEKPWRSKDGELAMNLKSKKRYRGINTYLLDASAMVAGYSSPYWVTFKQAKEFGGSVKKGEKGTVIVFWKPVSKEKAKDGKAYCILRYYRVWNVQQCEGFEDKIPKPVEVEEGRIHTPIEECEDIWNGYENKPEVRYGGNQAAWAPELDIMMMPNPEDFKASESFYSTLFHEAVHTTGHKSRLARDWSTNFGSEKYSKEELVAEMGAAFLCGVAGIENNTIEDSASYIAHWKSKLEGDKKLIVQAAGKAQKASDYILGVSWDVPVETESEEENA